MKAVLVLALVAACAGKDDVGDEGGTDDGQGKRGSQKGGKAPGAGGQDGCVTL